MCLCAAINEYDDREPHLTFLFHYVPATSVAYLPRSFLFGHCPVRLRQILGTTRKEKTRRGKAPPKTRKETFRCMSAPLESLEVRCGAGYRRKHAQTAPCTNAARPHGKLILRGRSFLPPFPCWCLCSIPPTGNFKLWIELHLRGSECLSAWCQCVVWVFKC